MSRAGALDAGQPSGEAASDVLADGGLAPLYVDPIAGDDTRPCTLAFPCKTLKHTLPLVKDRQTLKLYGGIYSSATGESFELYVPDGATIEAATPGVPATLQGNVTQLDGGGATEVGLTFQGSGALRGVEITGFSFGLMASAGALTLEGVRFSRCGIAVALYGNADVTAMTTTIDGGGSGFELSGNASLSMTGGSISNLGSDCVGGVPLATSNGSTAILDTVTVTTNADAVRLYGGSSVQVKNSTFTNNGSRSCGINTHLDLGSGATLSLDVTEIYGGMGYGILAHGGALTMTGGSITGTGSDAIHVEAGELTVDGTSLAGTGRNQDANGIHVSSGAALRLRNSTITSNTIGVYIESLAGFRVCDLGTPAIPGGNTITDNLYGLEVSGSASQGIAAVGNTWNEGVQGADSGGHMVGGLTWTSSSSPGSNFAVSAVDGGGPFIVF